MYKFESNVHYFSKRMMNNVQEAIRTANEKSHMGVFVVCITKADEVLIVSEFAVNVRDDISKIVYHTETGYELLNKYYSNF